MSLVEAITNVVAGYGIAVLTQSIVFPLLGLWVSLGHNLLIGAIFTAVSVIRSYSLRRLFEAMRVRHTKRGTAVLNRTAANRKSEFD